MEIEWLGAAIGLEFFYNKKVKVRSFVSNTMSDNKSSKP
jgi:hypothetical protein